MYVHAFLQLWKVLLKTRNRVQPMKNALYPRLQAPKAVNPLERAEEPMNNRFQKPLHNPSNNTLQKRYNTPARTI